MKSVAWLTAEGVQAIHAELIDRYGGSAGLRDFGLLDSALAKAHNLHAYENERSIPALAAAYGWGLVKNHAFIDGNKRIALAAVVSFLDMNGYRLTCAEAEETAMVLRAAAGEITKEEWSRWVATAAAPK